MFTDVALSAVIVRFIVLKLFPMCNSQEQFTNGEQTNNIVCYGTQVGTHDVNRQRPVTKLRRIHSLYIQHTL